MTTVLANSRPKMTLSPGVKPGNSLCGRCPATKALLLTRLLC
jgi:hypothetical protein